MHELILSQQSPCSWWQISALFPFTHPLQGVQCCVLFLDAEELSRRRCEDSNPLSTLEMSCSEWIPDTTGSSESYHFKVALLLVTCPLPCYLVQQPSHQTIQDKLQRLGQEFFSLKRELSPSKHMCWRLGPQLVTIGRWWKLRVSVVGDFRSLNVCPLRRLWKPSLFSVHLLCWALIKLTAWSPLGQISLLKPSKQQNHLTMSPDLYTKEPKSSLSKLSITSIWYSKGKPARARMVTRKSGMLVHAGMSPNQAPGVISAPTFLWFFSLPHPKHSTLTFLSPASLRRCRSFAGAP